ncbi:MAG: TetR/AcrR family transcriptional regulator [Alphaproteobacteria bacterium]|nr:TetR/AcrR family transcriptional regulator [Alphaproteobacteria bacterium]
MQKAERRAAILEVARRSFFENGYAATSMSEIAAKLGGSKGTLWSYFPSKADLFAAMIDDATIEFRQQLNELLQRHEDVRSTLMRLCLHFVGRLTDSTAICLYRLIHGEGGRFPEIGPIFHERGPRNVRNMVAAYLDQCIAEGTIRKVDTMVAANNLTALCMAGAYQKMLLNMIDSATEEDIQTDAENAVDIFMRAYGVHHNEMSDDLN